MKVVLKLLFVIAAIHLFANCSGNKNEEVKNSPEVINTEVSSIDSEISSSDESSEPQFRVDAGFQKQIADLFASYIKLKEAFVSSNPARVQTESLAISATLRQVDMKLLSGPSHNEWVNFMASIQSSLRAIESSTDIETQRRAFSTLSESMYKTIRAFGLGGKDAFYEFCPMAFNNVGAYWLSDEEEIRNPYFGNTMLTCGSVEEKLK
jgi:hypothetical protein